MRYTTKIGVLFFAIFLFAGIMAENTFGQRRGYVRRPIIVRHYGYDPFWQPYGWWGNDPYFNDPYLYHQREKYYKEKAVKDARRKLSEDREKYGSDGVITAKEQEKLDKRARDYNKAVNKLDDFRRDSD